MSSLYAVADIASDTIFRHVSASDAAVLARATGVPAIAWGTFWVLVSVATLFGVVRRLR